MKSTTTARVFIALTSVACLTACAVSPSTTPPEISDKITAAEAKRLACPVNVLNAGASPEDCTCVKTKLFELGQKPGAITYENAAPSDKFGEAQGKRDIAIGILRLDAYEHCGLFDPSHAVAKNL